MNSKRYFLLTGLLLLCVTFAYSFGSKEKDTPAYEIVQISGVVRLVGTANFPELVITNSDGDWHITADETYKLHDLQQQRVTVEGEATVIERKSTSGTFNMTRRVLKNVRIISVG